MNQPFSITNKLSKVIQEAIDRHGWVFTMQSEVLTSEEVASPNGFLPLLLESASLVAGKSLGDKWPFVSKYEYDQSALCQMLPIQEMMNKYPISILALSIDFALEEKVKDTIKAQPPKLSKEMPSVPLDDWMNKFIERYQSKLIDVVSPSIPTPQSSNI